MGRQKKVQRQREIKRQREVQRQRDNNAERCANRSAGRTYHAQTETERDRER